MNHQQSMARSCALPQQKSHENPKQAHSCFHRQTGGVLFDRHCAHFCAIADEEAEKSALG